jgi:hypothetical protein
MHRQTPRTKYYPVQTAHGPKVRIKFSMLTVCSAQRLLWISCFVNEKRTSGVKVSRNRGYEFHGSQLQGPFPKPLAIRLLQSKWGGSHRRSGFFFTTSALETKGWAICSQQTCSLALWTPREVGVGKPHTFPIRQHLPWPVPAVVWVSAETFGPPQIQDLQPLGSYQFPGMLIRYIPGQ